MNTIIDNIREHSVKNMESSKGISNYIAESREKEQVVSATETGYVFGSVELPGNSPIYGNPNEKERTLVDEISESSLDSAEARKNQMAVLANTTTPEDLKKMEEDGYTLDNTSSRTIVTVSEQIKANIAKTGGEVSGEISKEALEEIVGNSYVAVQIAQTMQKNDLPLNEQNVEEITELAHMYDSIRDMTVQEELYLVKNSYAPTVENVYKAEHSSGLPVSRNEINIEEFRGQVEEAIKSAGLPVNEETLREAQTLIENQIPLNEETIEYFHELNGWTKAGVGGAQLGEAVCDALAEGSDIKAAMLLKGYSLSDQAREGKDILADVTDDDLAYCVENNLELSINNFKLAKAHRGQVEPSKYAQDLKFITAKRVLEETRLSMTSEANLSLLKKGITIDTKALEALVEDLKNIERNFYENLLAGEGIEPTEEKVNSFAKTIDVLAGLKSAPATILSVEEVEETLNHLSEKAKVQTADYQKANEEYEKLWTAPRKDMGDSIQKAFRNVDDILEDLNLEKTAANQRAVRILAYNSTEITAENIAVIREKDAQMQRLFTDLTPRTTLEMIRRDINPLDIPVEQLNKIAESIKTEIGDEGAERFEKFLYKLEQNKDISLDERDSYIGIYRLIAQVEKSDGAALGAAYEQGSEITMRSLLTQLRNNAKKNMDYEIDDQIDGLNATMTGAKIDQQISKAFSHANANNDSMQQWQSALESYEQMVAKEDDAFYAESLKELQNAAMSAEEVYEYLEHLDMPNTVSNVLAAERLLAHPGNAISSLWKAKDKLSEAKEILLERFSEAVKSPTELADALQTLEEVAAHCMDSMVEEGENVSAMDIKELQLANKQISLAVREAQEESFLIPMETADGEVTGVSLKIVRGSGKKGLVDILFESMSLGKVRASIEARADGVSGTILCDDPEVKEVMSQKMQMLAQELAGEDGEAVDLQVLYEKELILKQQKPSRDEVSNDEYDVQTGRLYRIAKSFIEFASEI